MVEFDKITEPQEWIDALVGKYSPNSGDVDVAIQNMGLKIRELEAANSALSARYVEACDRADGLAQQLARNQMCTVCAGDKKSAKEINCICGAIGTVWAENDGLRQSLAETRDFKSELEHVLGNANDEIESLQAQLQAVTVEAHRFRGLARALCSHDNGWTEDTPGGNKCCNICGGIIQPPTQEGGGCG